ncbi:pentapeptide repeat-containing protein [Streptomyces sp. NPDC015127]|uniref:pentapeptide repeat-containing protein n=1 Tax=Streptomyces sp. NPDC015127 TaxID=3364939 RepID=UPI0036FA951C
MILSLPGLAALAALLFTWMQVGQTTQELRIIEQGQITNRFTAAIGHLGSGSMDVRLGGIYALGRIMNDSDRDQRTVMSVLSAYVREHAPLPTGSTKQPDAEAVRISVPADVSAALSVLTSRRPELDGGLKIDLRRTDLRHWDSMPGASATFVHLDGAILTRTDLRAADLVNGRFRGAELIQANLSEAAMFGADLSHADLGMAQLRNTDLGDAHLSGASFCDNQSGECADLTGTALIGADLTHTRLSGADLSKAIFCAKVRREGAQKPVLECAALSGANLTGTALNGVDLAGANLSGADLTDANLTNTDLRNADLRKANLTRAHLEGAKLGGAHLDGARGLPPSLR